MDHNQLKLIGGSLKGLSIPAASRNEIPTEAGLLKVRGGILVLSKAGASGLEWQQAVDTRDVLYDFATHTFTNAGKTGRTGPTLAQCKTAYAAAVQWINNAAWFGVTATGIQEWTVPVTGYYRIRARGASRYFGVTASAPDTRPETDAVFRLLKGDKLRIAVGQLGYYPPNVGLPISGSGGTFVQSAEQGLLAVGGGAGGWLASQSTEGVTTRLAGVSVHGGILQQPQAAEGKAGIRRTYTEGNQSSTGYGGASYDDDFSTDSLAPKSFLNGATGGTNIDRVSTHMGGFGGGGSGGVNYNSSYNATCCGGGGGYTGGDAAGRSNNGARAGDGGCFIADFGTDQNFIMTPLTSAQHGRVIVDLVG